MDPFNEVNPPTSDPTFIANVGKAIYNSMYQGDNQGVSIYIRSIHILYIYPYIYLLSLLYLYILFIRSIYMFIHNDLLLLVCLLYTDYYYYY